MANFLERLDSQLAGLVSDWNTNTTILAVLIAALVLYPVLFPIETDTHPLLLARQSAIAPVRNKFASAAYRSPEVPYGTSLRGGLNVKDPAAPRWADGKDGDLRDVWREVQRGGEMRKVRQPNGTFTEEKVPKALIMTVLGKEEIVEHDSAQLSREIQIIGQHLKAKGSQRVAIYLPNNVEYLLTLFACAFYGMTPILLPYNLPQLAVYALINATTANTLVCAAGSLPLDDVAEKCTNIRLLTWVVEKSSRHMDWHGVPDSAKKRLSVSVWHDVVEDNLANSTPNLPTNEEGDPLANIVAVWHSPYKPAIVSFTHANLVSAIGALISALPLRQRFSPADLVLPASSFHLPYVLCQTLAALYTHANLAITSVAQAGVDFDLATRGVSPTVVIASIETLRALHKHRLNAGSSLIEEFAKFRFSQTMASGHLPGPDSIIYRLLTTTAIASKRGNPGALRLILTAERLDTDAPRLTSKLLSELRLMMRCRICYALTAAKVAGAVAQTHVYDYRIKPGKARNFGISLSSVEVWLEDKANDARVAGVTPEGEIVVSGPAVSGYDRSSGKGETKLDVRGRFEEDGTLSIA